MCGFVAMAALNGSSADPAIIARMIGVIRHRGPDDEGTFFSGPVAMGFRRLSILDLSPLGHQPMLSEDGKVVLVFNGEIYNYLELRSELQALGHRFKSTGDTEVLLHAYLQWGTDCVTKLNGMWAFIIYDGREGKLFGSRDRFGIKPLFRYRAADCWLFGSEIKAIRASGLCDAGINWRVAADYLMNGRLDTTEQTFYAGIEQVRPAASFEVNREGAYREWTYWSLEDAPAVDSRHPAEEFAELFEDAMRLHMRSDVPVGVHLSGGLDSTAIICATARWRSSQKAPGSLLAFCYQAQEFDESGLIADTVRQTKAAVFDLETSAQAVWDDLSSMVRAQDEPAHSMTAIIGYQLMRLTARHGLKVVLNGQGADETLAGYPSYFRDYWNTLLREGRIGETWHEIGSYVAVHGGQRSGVFLRQLRHFLQGKLHMFDGYRRLASWNDRRRARSDDWFTPGLSRYLPVSRSSGGHGDLNEALSRSIGSDPLSLYLRVEDRNSMAHSVEARVPFLDYRLVSFAYRLPANWRMRGPWNKFLLREAMRGRIPETVRTRSGKLGFPVPVSKWIAGPLYEVIKERVTSRQARERGIYDMDAILRDLERCRRGEVDASANLFRVAQFEIWSTL
ncbi:MAG TPA: asparagine synthase (glutamine-hydrolyzing) [Burkholderiales bacterium]|nr:asparagine synthase (glutamine-hydrolyzing) [Burkholderiales bacterium]